MHALAVLFLLLPFRAFASEPGFNSATLALLKAGAPDVPAVTEPTASVRELTFMVFVNGKNSLDKYVDKDINEMEAVGSGPRMDIVVQAGRLNSGVKRYHVQKDNNPDRVTSPVLQDLGRYDMGDWKGLVDFVRWAKASYPAKRYVLVVWNHGNGWKEYPGIYKGISYDDESGNHITTLELGQAMRAAGPVDIFATDACFMQMAEVAYELKDSAKFIIGSEESAPGNGYPYDKVLANVEARLGSGPGVLAQAIVSAYHAYYMPKAERAYLSVLDAAQLERLALLVRQWTEAVTASAEGPAIKYGVRRAKSYDKPEYRDLRDIMRRTLKTARDPVVRSRTEAVLAHLRERLVTANCALDIENGEDPDSGGISIQMTDAGYSQDYFPLAWTRASGWLDFLKIAPQSQATR